MTDSSPSFDAVSIAAFLVQRSREDRAALLDDLVAMLSGIVPDAQVERTLLGRRVTGVRVPVGSYVYILRRGAGETFEPKRQQLVRGVAIRTDPLEIEPFLEELGLALDAELRRTERGRDALRTWLNGRKD